MRHYTALFLTLAALCAATAMHAQNDYIVTTYDTPEADAEGAATTADTSDPEQRFLIENFPYLSLCDWQPGLRFIVIPDREDTFIRTFTDSVTAREIGTGELQYKQLEYRGMERTPRGWFRLHFYCIDNQHPYYAEIRNVTFEDYCRRLQGGGVPALAYLGDVDKARELLMGHDLWLKSPIVYRDSPSSPNGYVETQLHADDHVRVERIGVGTRAYPVKIVFRADDGQLYFNNVAMSCTNSAMGEDDFITTRAHHHFAKAFSLGSQTDTQSAKMSESLVGKNITLRRACTMTLAGVETPMKAATTFVVQTVRQRTGTNYYTLTLTSGGKVYRKDVTFVQTSVVGNIAGNDEGYFDDLFTIGTTYVASDSQIRQTRTVTQTRGKKGGTSSSRSKTTTTTTGQTSGDFTGLMGGIVSKGMSRDQVRMAKGDPDRSRTLNSGGTQWDYDDGTKVQFNSDGIVTRVIR